MRELEMSRGGDVVLDDLYWERFDRFTLPVCDHEYHQQPQGAPLHDPRRAKAKDSQLRILKSGTPAVPEDRCRFADSFIEGFDTATDLPSSMTNIKITPLQET
jgi:hypothetical protein